MRRRDFLAASARAAAALLTFSCGGLTTASAVVGGRLSDDQLAALRESPFVYVSPLKSDGSESRCHAEVWFAWLDESVVMIVSTAGWKSTSVDRGLERARIWVGDFGRVEGMLAQNDAFRAGPSFVARAQKSDDPALLERLLATYDRKYPEEMGRWRDRMREGQADGSRSLIRYQPEAGELRPPVDGSP